MAPKRPTAKEITNPAFWAAINPALSIGEPGPPTPDALLRPSATQLAMSRSDLLEEGYFRLDRCFEAEELASLTDGIARLVKAGWPAPFSFVYDQAWAPFARLSPLLGALLGEDYRVLPNFWAWHVAIGPGESGWRPHRDQSQPSLFEDGSPKSLSVWIALSDATPLNGCIYVVPAHADPYYRAEVRLMHVRDPQSVRALPAERGTVLAWNQALLHWSGKSSKKATEPRISISVEFQRADQPPFNEPLLDPSRPPPFLERLALIGRQILKYEHLNPLSDVVTELARTLSEEPA